jgi:1-deoxy-D-xylulose-5-phosphate synthase
VWDVRCCSPLDPEMLADAAQHHTVLTFEDGIRDGGIGMSAADQMRAINAEVPVQVFGLPDRFIPQGNADRILAALGLDADGIAVSIRAAI